MNDEEEFNFLDTCLDTSDEANDKVGNKTFTQTTINDAIVGDKVLATEMSATLQ